MAKKRIGIDALFQTSVPRAVPDVKEGTGEFREVELERIRPGAHQPRRHFDEAAMGQLVDSIRAQGVLQPVLVRPAGEGEYELVAGERRWRAAQAAGLDRIPARVVEFDDRQTLTAAIVENLQREDLNPVEEAEGYLELLRARLDGEPDFAAYRDPDAPLAGVVRLLRALSNRLAGLTKDNVVLNLEPAVAEVFSSVGRLTWQSFTTHRLPLLSMPAEITAALRSNQLPYTKARHIARLTADRLGTDEAHARRVRRDLVEQAVTEGLSVRGLQAEVSRLLAEPDAPPAGSEPARRSSGSTGLARRVNVLVQALQSLQVDELGPSRRAEVASAVEALLKLL